MKSHSILTAGLVYAFLLLPLGAYAAADADKPAEASTSTTAPDKAAPARKLKKHSHMEERTGAPPKEAAPTSVKPHAARDMSKHYHPRDAK